MRSFKFKMTDLYGARTASALELWVKLARAFGTMNRHAVEDIRRYGLTQGQFGVIEALGHLGELTLGDLSRKQLSSCGNTTVVVDNLEKEGLVRRRQCGKDRRRTYVGLTPVGKRLFQNSFRHHASRIQKLAGGLNESEKSALSALLKKLGSSIQDGHQTKPGRKKEE